MIKILVVEDEQAIRDLLYLHLTGAGYDCERAQDGAEAADLLDTHSFDLVLLDIMLPEIDGYELMDYIKPLGIPVIFVTAKHEVKDRIKGLRLGADDYLIKPFDMMELIARVETVLRRYQKTENKADVADVQVDFEARTAIKNNKYIDLTVKEFGLLELFIRNQNIALYRKIIYEKVWEREYDGDSRTVDLHVQRLRKKLGWEDCLLTVYKVGYRLEVHQ